MINTSNGVHIYFDEYEAKDLVMEIDRLFKNITYTEEKTFIQLKELRYELNKEEDR